MKGKEYLKKNYSKFSDFIAEASKMELEHYILSGDFTTYFSKKIRDIYNELISSNKTPLEFMVMFNTEGDVVIIEGELLGKFIAAKYRMDMCKAYEEDSLNKIIRNIKQNNIDEQLKFIMESYNTIYSTLRLIYKNIKCKKEVTDEYRDYYLLYSYTKEDLQLVICTLLILEDICKYINISTAIMFSCIDKLVK